MGLESDLIKWMEAVQDRKFSLLFDSGMKLVTFNDVSAFLDWAEEQSLTLLGAEGFQYSRGDLTPVTDCILDYSTGDPLKSIEMHRKIIEGSEKWKMSDFVEFTVAD